MKLTLKIVFFFLLLFETSLFALKPVNIDGYASFAKGKEIRFYFYNDLLNKNKVLITTAKVNDSGYFSIKIPTLEIRELIFSFNTTDGSIFIEPEKTYHLSLYTNENLVNQLNAIALGNSIQIKINNSDSNELNWKINYFNTYYNYFLYKHSLAIINMVKQTIYDSLMNIIVSKFPISTNPTDFYSIYVKFRIAEIEGMYLKKYPAKLYANYLDNKYIYYNNPAYMDFFTGFFNNYLYCGSKQITRNLLIEDINLTNDYFKLLDDLGKDPLLVNEIIREMVLIENLQNLFSYKEEFNLVNILTMLKKLSENTKFQEHKQMAENTINALKTLQHGTHAPEFALKDIHNNTINLTDYKGKYIYLHFFTADCEECIREMLIINNLYNNYHQKVEFISVMLDFETTKLYHFVNTYPNFKWKFTHFNNDFTFIENYKTYSLPLGMLIDPNGYIISYPTPSTKDLGAFFESTFSNTLPETNSKKQ